MSRHHERELDIYHYIKVLGGRKKAILLVSVLFFFASLALAFLLPNIYVANTSILPPVNEGSGNFDSQVPGVGALAGGLLMSKSPVGIWMGILESDMIADRVIGRFKLMESFEAETIDDARERFRKMAEVEKTKEDIILISVSDTDPERAAEIANAMAEELDKVNKDLAMTSGKRTRLFIEGRLKEAKDELQRTEEEVKSFQEENRAVKIDEQSRSVIEAIGAVRGQLVAKDVELQTLLSYASPSNYQAEILKTEVDELRKKIREMEEGERGGNRNILIPTAQLPDLALRYARVLRDLKVQETVYGLLTQQYEMAKIQEAKDTPTIQVLDFAKPPERHLKPARGLIVAFSTLAAAFMAAAFILLKEAFKKNMPAEEIK